MARDPRLALGMKSHREVLSEKLVRMVSQSLRLRLQERVFALARIEVWRRVLPRKTAVSFPLAALRCPWPGLSGFLPEAGQCRCVSRVGFLPTRSLAKFAPWRCLQERRGEGEAEQASGHSAGEKPRAGEGGRPCLTVTVSRKSGTDSFPYRRKVILGPGPSCDINKRPLLGQEKPVTCRSEHWPHAHFTHLCGIYIQTPLSPQTADSLGPETACRALSPCDFNWGSHLRMIFAPTPH